MTGWMPLASSCECSPGMKLVTKDDLPLLKPPATATRDFAARCGRVAQQFHMQTDGLGLLKHHARNIGWQLKPLYILREFTRKPALELAQGGIFGWLAVEDIADQPVAALDQLSCGLQLSMLLLKTLMRGLQLCMCVLQRGMRALQLLKLTSLQFMGLRQCRISVCALTQLLRLCGVLCLQLSVQGQVLKR